MNAGAASPELDDLQAGQPVDARILPDDLPVLLPVIRQLRDVLRARRYNLNGAQVFIPASTQRDALRLDCALTRVLDALEAAP